MSGFQRAALSWVTISILCLGAGPASAFDDPDVIGPNFVGHTEYSIFDAARAGRELPLQIWYPADPTAWAAEPTFTLTILIPGIGLRSTVAKDDIALPAGQTYPLIVFSHGFGSFNIQSLPLMEHLASHGFVVVAPNHTGNTQDDMSSPNPEADRFPDVAFVIDEMAAADGNAASLFFEHVDAANAGVAGHSYGGMTAQFMGAGYGGTPADTRVKAIMPIAPSSAALSDSDLQGITIPTTLLVGTIDGLRTQAIRSLTLQSSAPDLVLMEVIGANHTHFSNVCAIGDALINAGLGQEFWEALGAGALIPVYNSTCVPPAFPIAEAERLQNLFAAATFRRYLLADTAYATYLTKAFADTEPDVHFYEIAPGLIPGQIPVMPPLAQLALVAGLLAAGAVSMRRSRRR